MKDLRTLAVRLAASYTPRTETFEGREYLVVPVVALVETVVHASNAANAELVTAEEFSKVPIGWNGRPVFHGHPQANGAYVSGNDPGVLESLQIGMVFNTHVEDEKLKMEAWLDVEKTKAIAPELLERIAAEEVIQISVGLSVATAKESGVYNGKEYKGVWREMVPDHLAILPEDEIGACSVEAGCGVRAATAGGQTMSEKAGGVVRMLTGFMRQAAEALRANQSAGDMSVNDIRQKLGEALRALDPRVYYADDFYPEKGEVIYSVYNGDGAYKCYMRSYTLSESGEVSITGDPVEVQSVISYEKVGGDEVVAATTTTATAAPCSCQHPKAEAAPVTSLTKENGIMTKDELKAQIDAMTAEQLAGVTLTPAAAPAAAVVETPAAAPVVATAAPTFQSLLDAATPEIRESFAAVQRTLAANKAAAIKTLKDSGRCKISDEKLASMSQAELNDLVALTGVVVAETVDFGVNAPRVAAEADESVPAPQDLVTVLSARK